MDKPWLLAFQTDQILYFPTQMCPQCGASSVTHSGGELYQPYQNLMGVGLEYDSYFGYLQFDCGCHLNMSSPNNPHLAGSLRVARVGDAMLPVSFVTIYTTEVKNWGLRAAEVNNARVRQAVQFLAAHADQRALAGTDALKALVYAISAGQSPERAYRTIKTMILGGASVWQPAHMPTEIPV